MMKEYAERILHRSIWERPFEGGDRLPLAYRNGLELRVLELDGQEFLMAAPTEELNLTELRKLSLRLDHLTGYRSALYLRKMTRYAATKLVEEGIPFVWEGHQVYLPFFGMLLREETVRTPKPCPQISFITQKLLLMALYDSWRDISGTRAAKLLGVSGMTVTRCYDEIEAMGLPFLTTGQRSRRFTAPSDRREMWHQLRSHMRTPLIRRFYPEKCPKADMTLSGISALAGYTMLGEDEIPTFAICKARIEELGLKRLREVPTGETPACVIHEVGYILPFADGKAVDPLSLTLLMTEQELADPRVKRCVDDMLEEWVWSRD